LHRRAVKRALDLGVSSVALVFFSPLLAVIGCAVKVSSPGPMLFRQERIGRSGRRFRILKFRTMVEGAPHQGPAITASGDPRVTRLGRFLRRAKLDELPQLLNVWLGDMSLVGPRPEVPRYVENYSAEDRPVLGVRPGITDLASITYRDEESVLAQFPDRERAYVTVLLPRKLALARDYLRRQSFRFDLELLLRTLLVVVHPRREAGAAAAQILESAALGLPSGGPPPIPSSRR
jgi:lipopolysaccharide/colanic/teichoic acid biosynthesis glycosyltransferase